VEDQQPAAGDLTVDAAVATDVTEGAEVEATQSDAGSEETATKKKGRRLLRNRRFGGKRAPAVTTDVTEAVEVDTTSEAGSEEIEAAETDGGNEEAAATEETSVATDVTEAAEVEQAAEGEEADVAEEAEVTEEAETLESAETLENGKTLKSKTTKNKRNKRARRPRTKPLIGKRTAVGIVVAASLLFVGSAGFAGAATQRYLSERAVIATKLNVARTAANAITTLWSYTPENMDTLADRAANYLSGDFAAQYRKFVDAITAPNKQAKISSNTLVTGAAVETLDGPNAIAIVYTNTTSSSALKKNIPSLKYLSYRVNLKHDHGRWLVTRMTTVTQLDITPRI